MDPAASPYEGNEKLEYLGDAVLTLVVSESLLAGYPSWREGQLPKARASLVNAGALAEAARRLDLGAYFRLGRGEEKTGGREAALLADAYEAVVAALYLMAAWTPHEPLSKQSLLSTAMDGPTGRPLGEADHKSRLQEMLQARGWAPADYRVVNEIGPGSPKTFEVEARVTGRGSATGSGLNKKEAERPRVICCCRFLERAILARRRMADATGIVETEAAGPVSEERQRVSAWEYLESLLVTIILALFLTSFVVQSFKIPSQSMEPTLLVGDHLLVNKFIFGGTGRGTKNFCPTEKSAAGTLLSSSILSTTIHTM